MNDKVTTSARPNRKSVSRPVDAPRPWYVYDDSAEFVGGKPVTKKDDDRVVILTESEAQFFLDQGTLGDKPLDRRSAKAAEVIEQATGVSEPGKKKQ